MALGSNLNETLHASHSATREHRGRQLFLAAQLLTGCFHLDADDLHRTKAVAAVGTDVQ